MANPRSRTTAPLDRRLSQNDPLTQWWTHDDVICVALRSVNLLPVLTIAGRLDRAGATPCRRALESALKARPHSLVTDLSGLTGEDGDGVALLEGMRRAAAWHGCAMWLASVPDTLRTRLHHAGALDLFRTARTAARAIEEIRRTAATSAARRPAHTPPHGVVHRAVTGSLPAIDLRPTETGRRLDSRTA